jgi:amylosucrase
VQNVHAMRPQVRAEFEAALDVVDGDAAFRVRLERFFTELRDPLVALYGSDARFAEAWGTLLRAIASTAAGRSPELRELDHEREITPDWLQREQAVGYVAYVDRFAGTLAGVRERLEYLRELGVRPSQVVPLVEPGDRALVAEGAVWAAMVVGP